VLLNLGANRLSAPWLAVLGMLFFVAQVSAGLYVLGSTVLEDRLQVRFCFDVASTCSLPRSLTLVAPISCS
jgi:hypothetical protein